MEQSECIMDYLKDSAEHAWDNFHMYVNTDENKEFMRGFRAGVLYASLQIKSDLQDIQNAAIK